MSESSVIPQRTSPRGGPSRIFGIKLIKVRFQVKFSFVIFTFLALTSLILYLYGKISIEKMVESGMIVGEDALVSVEILTRSIGHIAIFALAIVFGLSLFFSHYVAGPIYRFERTLEDMRDGNLSQHVKLRRYDEFKEVADLFNQTIVSLRNKLKKERETVHSHVEKMEELAARLKKAGYKEEAAELQNLLVEMKNSPPQIKI